MTHSHLSGSEKGAIVRALCADANPDANKAAAVSAADPVVRNPDFILILVTPSSKESLVNNLPQSRQRAIDKPE